MRTKSPSALYLNDHIITKHTTGPLIVEIQFRCDHQFVPLFISSLWLSTKYNIRNKNRHRFICFVIDAYFDNELKSCSHTSVVDVLKEIKKYHLVNKV